MAAAVRTAKTKQEPEKLMRGAMIEKMTLKEMQEAIQPQEIPDEWNGVWERTPLSKG
jgi:hypothetical protein